MEERCNIGCGCGKGKSRVSRGQRLSSQRKNQIAARNKQILLAKKTKKQKQKQTNVLKKPLEANQKSVICSTCPKSAQTSKEKQRGLKICHKSNRLIINLIKDRRFICPIGKWK